MAKQTHLFSIHSELGALFVDFAGWQMPIHFGSQLDEHQQVRTHAGIFDVSHMSVVDIKGPDAKKYLRNLLANDVDKLAQPGKALYGCMLNEQGGILDDLITYYIANDHYRVVVNAATTSKDLAWMNEHVAGYSVEINHRDDLSMLAVQGPKAIEIVSKCLAKEIVDVVTQLKPFECRFVGEWFIARTGYTGEDGIEIMLPHADAQECAQTLTSKGVAPIGLGARDTLRLEAGLNLYGNDMDESTTPYQSNLAWTVALQDTSRDFIGRKALEAQKAAGIDQRLIGLVLLDKGVLRTGVEVFDNEEKVGTVTSGTFSPTLKRSIAFARVKTPVAEQYTVQIRGKKYAAKVVKAPFVKKGQPNFEL